MAARLAAENATPAEIAAIRELLEDMETVCRRGDIGALRRLSGEFHQLVCSASHNNRLLQSLRSLLDHVRQSETSTLYKEGRPPQALEEYRALLHAIEQLPLLKGALDESLRLYPPTHRIGRTVKTPVMVGGNLLPRESSFAFVSARPAEG